MSFDWKTQKRERERERERERRTKMRETMKKSVKKEGRDTTWNTETILRKDNEQKERELKIRRMGEGERETKCRVQER